MAPGGPRNTNAPTGPRGGRNAGNAGKPNGRAGAGVSKRRGPAGSKVDRDGDLDMDGPAGGKNAPRSNKTAAPTGPARRSTRTSNTNAHPNKATGAAKQIISRIVAGGEGSLASRINSAASGSTRPSRSRAVNAANTTTLRVQGLKNTKAASNAGGGLKELLTFLERKATTVGQLTRTVRIKKSQLNGDYVYITASKEDAQEILKLNNFVFAGGQIQITEAPEGMPSGDTSGPSSNAVQIKEQMQAVLSQRYDINAKLLNLSSLGEDPVLREMGLFDGETRPEKMFKALMAVCDMLFTSAQQKRDAVISISLAGNSVDDVLQIMSLADTFPDLINLDLSRNQFKDIKGLRKWQHRLRRLETLLLNENPLETANPDYKVELTSWFPKLQNLSGTQVRTPEQVAAQAAASRPTPVPQSGADFRDINRIGEGFITEFVNMYDHDRHGLAAKYYDSQSQFSLAVNTHSPHAANVPIASWASYIKYSRNFMRITNPGPRSQRLFIGTNVIQSAWQQLPATRHPDLQTQFDKYIIDCHPIQGLPDPSGQSPAGADGMVMVIHGEFEDQDPETKNTAKRSFSRTFILGPGVPGNNPIRVISDSLSLKAFNNLPTASAAPAPVPVPVPASVPVVAPAAVPASTEEAQKQAIVLQLCQQTGMTPEYSQMCLEVANWNIDQALVTFNEKRAQLPVEAFAAGAA